MKKVLSVLLVVCMLFSMFSTVMAEETTDTTAFTTARVVYFPLSEAVGANSKVFLSLEEGKAATDFPEGYYKGLDFAGRALKADLSLTDGDTAKTIQAPTGTATDKAVVDSENKGDPLQWLLYQTTTETTDVSSGKTGVVLYDDGAGNYWWRIKEGQYEVVPPSGDVTTYSLKWNDLKESKWLVNPNEKIVKIVPTDTQYIQDADLKAKFETLNEAVIDVEDGRYTDVSFLIGAEGWQRSMYITPVYKDGDGKKESFTIRHYDAYKIKDASTGTTTGTIGDIAFSWSSPMLNYYYGNLYLKHFDGEVGNNGVIKFRPTTIEADPSRVLDKIKFTAQANKDHPLYVVSMKATAITTETLINELATINETAITDSASLKIAEDKKNEIDAHLAKMSKTASDLPAEMKEVYDIAVANIDAYYVAIEGSKLDKSEYKDISISHAYNAKMYQDYSKGTITIDSSEGINTTEYDYFLDWANMPGPWNGIVVAPDHKVTDAETGEERLSVEGTDTLTYNGTARTIEKTWDHYPLYYKVEEPTNNIKNYMTLDENHYYSIKTADGIVMNYHIDVTSGKALKLLAYQSYLISQLGEERIAELNKLKTAFIDIEDGYYDKLHFLMLNVRNGIIGNDAKIKYTINYDSGNPDTFDDVVLKQNHHTTDTTEKGVFNVGGRVQRPESIKLDVDEGRKVVSVKVEVKEVTRDVMLFSMVGETATLRMMLESITDTTVTSDNYAGCKELLKSIDDAAKEADVNLETTAPDLYAKYVALSQAVSNYGAQYSKVVNIPIAPTANVKMFSNYDIESERTVDYSEGLATTEYNYLADYINTITYDTIAVYPDYEGDEVTYNEKSYTALKTWKHSPLPYSKTRTGGQWANYFPIDENGNWTLGMYGEEGTTRTWNIDVDTNGKAIVFHKYSPYQTSQLNEEDLAKVKSMESAYINVPEGYYDSIHFLMADLTNNGHEYNVNAEVVYTDGTVDNRTFRIKNTSIELKGIEGKTYAYSYNGYLVADGGKLFTGNSISVNPVKKVERINFSGVDGAKSLMISAQGQSATVKSMINYLPEEITGENYSAMTEVRTELNRLISEFDIDLTKDSALNSKYNEFNEKMAEVEKEIIINKISYVKDVITVNATNFTGKAKAFELIAAVYNEDETQLLEKHIVRKTVADKSDCVDITESFKVTAEGNYKLKIMIWDGFNTLKPLTNVYDSKNKVYMFVGDSITHADVYPTLVESYYISRFPANYATFENAGHSGGTANTALKRYDYDIANRNASEAIIMFGMNDVGRNNWPLGPEEEGYDAQLEANQRMIDNCVNNITTLANKLVEADTAVTLMTPSIYDTRDNYTSTTNYKGCNSGLTEIAEREKVLARELGLDLINLHDYMNTINNKVLNTGVEEMISSDRVHPNGRGALVIAYNVINHWFPNSGLVSNVEINATTGASNVENATVKEVSTANGEVSYYYTPKALPWHNTYYHQIAEQNGYVNVTEELNREIIKVTGLETATTYTIKFNGEKVTTATGAQLAEGINIATITTNPGQIAAKAVYDNIDAKRKLVVELRDHYRLYTNGNITALDQELIDTNNEKIQAFVEAAREAAQPRRYVVTITK